MTSYEPCARCGREHDTSKCPDDPNFWKHRGARLRRWQRRAARAGGLGRASSLRIQRTLTKMREET